MANPTALMIQLLEEQLALLKKHMALLRSEGSTHERSGMPQLSHPIAKKGKAVSKTPAPVIQEDSGLPEASQLTLNDTGGAPNRLLPAKAPNAFALYMNQNMLTCKKANPFKKMSQLILILSLSWKDVPSKEKKIFRDQAAALNAARTAELMATTTPELVVEFKNILAKKKIVEEKVEKILDIEEEEDDDAPVILCRNQKKKLFKDKILITTPKGKKNHKKRKSVELKSDLVGMEVKVPPFTSASVFTPTDILIASNKSHKKKQKMEMKATATV